MNIEFRPAMTATSSPAFPAIRTKQDVSLDELLTDYSGSQEASRNLRRILGLVTDNKVGQARTELTNLAINSLVNFQFPNFINYANALVEEGFATTQQLPILVADSILNNLDLIKAREDFLIVQSGGRPSPNEFSFGRRFNPPMSMSDLREWIQNERSFARFSVLESLKVGTINCPHLSEMFPQFLPSSRQTKALTTHEVGVLES